MDFLCILEAKFDDFGSQNAIKNQSKKQMNLGSIFEAILEKNLNGIGGICVRRGLAAGCLEFAPFWKTTGLQKFDFRP